MENASKHEIYGVWTSMKSRCLNPKGRSWHRYGGRGITVCPRWLNSFDAFVADMGPRPAGFILDRENNDGNYEPSNCRWVDTMTSGFNQRQTRMLTINGRTQHLAAWAREAGINSATLLGRYQRGMPPEKILSKEKFATASLGPKCIGRPNAARQQQMRDRLQAIVDNL